jgi:hypothetical protein
MILIADNETAITANLTLKEGLYNVTGHDSYEIQIDRPTNEIYALTVTTENERQTIVTWTLTATLPAGEYIYHVYSKNSGGTRIAEVDRGLLRVTGTTATYTEYSTNPNAYTEYD